MKYLLVIPVSAIGAGVGYLFWGSMGLRLCSLMGAGLAYLILNKEC
jgi:hypothetical protein